MVTAGSKSSINKGFSMNIVKVFKDGECGVMRCQGATSVLVDGASFGREGVQVPLCERHAAGDMTAAPPVLPAGTTLVVPETALAPQTMQIEAQSEVSAAQAALAEIKEFTIASDEDLKFAGEVLGEVKGHFNRLEERKKQATGPLNEALRTIRSWFAPAQDFYASSEKTLKDKIAAYHTMRAQERQAALAAAAAAHQTGDSAATQLAVSAVPAAPPKLAGVSVQDEWSYEVTDFALVPDKFKVIHHQLLMAVVKESKGATNIPGVKPVRTNKVVARAT